MRRVFFILVLFGSCLTMAAAQSKGDRYNGVWTVSRGGGGMGRIFVDGTNIKGVLMDTGWLQMTGERRIGQLAGTLKSGRATVTVTWSTGPKVEFQGKSQVQRQGLSLDLVQYAGSREVADTQFTFQGHQVGKALAEPFGDMSQLAVQQLAGEWSGSYKYGPNRGLAYVSIGWDGSCNVVMANESPNDDTWSAVGKVDTDADVLNLTVDSGFSKADYIGKVRSLGSDQIQVTFNRKNGEFVMTLSRW
ncbi:MAG: hypothetical protein JSS66_10065 [Armatimonadetes bacterium]|nr:hypothetical protein [Armatimonadota bacterium]